MTAFRYFLILAILSGSLAGALACGGGDEEEGGWTDDDNDTDDDNASMDDTAVDDDDDDDDHNWDDDSSSPDDTSPPDDDSDDDADDTVTDDTEPDDDLADDDTSAIFNIDFESYSLGALGSPWYIPIQSGDSTAQIVFLFKDGSGKGLRITGGTDAGDTIGVGYIFGDYSQDLRFNVDIKVQAGAVFGMEIFQHRSAQYMIEAEISNEDDPTKISAHNVLSGVYVDCRSMITGPWFKLSVIFDYDSYTYDVLVNDQFTSCSGVATAHTTPAPFAGIGFMDYGTEDFGGIFDVDNVAGKRFTAP